MSEKETYDSDPKDSLGGGEKRGMIDALSNNLSDRNISFYWG